jgi:hypothetical protein
MFMVIRKYGLAGSATEAARRVENDLVPLLKQVPGLQAYYAFDDGDGIGGSVSLFESEEAALASNEKALVWAREALADLVKGQAVEVIAGEVLVAFTARAPISSSLQGSSGRPPASE